MSGRGRATRIVAIALSAFVSVASAATSRPSEALASLIAAERGFARTSVDEGMRAAFLQWLDEDSIVFRPGPVDGRSWFEGRPDAAGKLLWEPAYAEISPAGDFGWTTGPYEYDPDDPAEPSGYGHYVSVWGRRTDGAWRVLVDHGTPHPESVTADGVGFPPHNAATASGSAVRADTVMTVSALLEADRALAADVARRGARRAYRAVAADDVRLCRVGRLPAVGRAAIGRVFGRREVDLTWTPEAAGASVSGTLGYTFGRARFGGHQPAEGEADVYLRIWRKVDERWALVVDVIPNPPTPSPPPADRDP